MIDSGLITIAIDGPCATGKGPLAIRLSKELGLYYLETGLLYRCIAREMMLRGSQATDVVLATNLANAIDQLDMSDPLLQAERIGMFASEIAKIPSLRAALTSYQRSVAKRRPGAVLDGRDIGTVVLPCATHKFYLIGTIESRVDRRCKDLAERGEIFKRDRVMSDMIERDRRDAERSDAPLCKPIDAYEIDTTGLRGVQIFLVAMRQIRKNYDRS